MIPDKLLAARYSAKRIGIGTPGSEAFLFVMPAPGETFTEEDLAILMAMLKTYNERERGHADE